MKKALLFIFIVVTFINLNGQELNGIWVSNDNLSNTKAKSLISQDGVSIIDFDKNSMTSINNRSHNKTIVLNKKETKIKINGLKGKFKVHKPNKEALVLTGKNNTRYTFKKLDSTYEFDLSTKEISSFLLSQQCGLIQGIQVEFKNEQFFIDNQSNAPKNRFQVINYSKRDNGYWYIKKMNKFAVLVFTTEQNKTENIFQITYLDLKGFQINQLYSDNQIKNLKLMKTCL